MRMTKAYLKTPKLKNAKFRGQRALVVEALSNSSDPLSLESVAAMADKNGRYGALLNDWAKENGGVKGSVLYHLRELKKRGMVEVSHATDSIRSCIVGWGNSPALRIPKAMLDELQISQGDEVELTVEQGQLKVRPLNPKLTLDSLLAAITPENCHKAFDWGKPVGKEVW